MRADISAGRAAAAGAVAASLLVGVAAPAAADAMATSKFVDLGCRVNFRAFASNVPGGLEDWSGFQTSEGCPLPFIAICNYKSELGWYHTNGNLLLSETWHAGWRGCSLGIQSKDWPAWTGRYVEDTRFKGKWASNHTPTGCCAPNGDYHLFEIGVLQH